MTTETTSLPLAPKPEEEKKTKAGNYFISNYPPFSFWSPEHLPALHEAIESPPEPNNPLGIYIHIPFCRKRCHFCYFKVYTDKNADQIMGYLNAAVDEFNLYAEKPFIGGRKPKFIYFGGGTPSYISPKQLHTLVDAMKETLPWDEAEEVAFEAEPGTLTEAKLQAIRDIGVTRLSLGIENFDDHILEINGRAHRTKEIRRAYDFARSIDFPQINIDLIAGMMEETEANWQKCVERTIELEPDCVTIYQMEIPFNTTIYQQMKEEGKLTAPVADWETKRRWAKEGFEALEAAGYTVTSGYTAVKDPKNVKFLYRDDLWAGADLLSIGVASFGHIGGVHYQNEKDFDPYVERIVNGDLPINRAYPMSDDEKLIREFILQMKLGELKFDYFQSKFGVDPRERFKTQLKTLQDEGRITVSDEGLSMDRDNLLQVDSMLPRFFLPEHQNPARYT